MKKVLTLSFTLAIGMTALAQLDQNAGTLLLKNYTNTTALNLQNDKVILKNGEKVDSFPVSKKGDIYTLRNLKDSTKFYQILGLNKEHPLEELRTNDGANSFEKLLTLTAQLKDKKLVLQGANAPILADSTVPEEGGQEVPLAPEQPAKSNWLSLAIASLIALAIGIILGRLTKKIAVHEPVAETKEKPAALVEKDLTNTTLAKDNAEVEKLKQELTSLQEKNALITDKTQRLISGDNTYYTAIFDKIILPLQTALNDGKQDDVVKYTNLAMVHFSSITRVKIRKKQNYDDANIQLITGNSSLAQEFPTIDGNTPIDKIPANLRVMIDLLKKAGVNGLDETIIKGYKLKNL